MVFGDKSMHFPGQSVPSTINLDAFLSQLKKTFLKYSDALVSLTEKIPHWAVNCAHLLYSDKSIPPALDTLEPGKLYLSYKIDDPSAVTLIGKLNDKKPIQRKLKINTKPASSYITLTSEHLNFATGRSFTCTGSGQSFKSALDHYFLTSLSAKNSYQYNTDGNVNQDGDAFLLAKVISTKGDEKWINEIINSLRKLFAVVSPEQHPAMVTAIEKNLQDFSQFIKTEKNKKMLLHYDPRLWIVIMAICQHFDPLIGQDKTPRQRLRDYIVADSCRKLMKEEDIIPGLASYFQALQMHLEITRHEERNTTETHLKTLRNEYQKNGYCPEITEHREKIKEYHARCTTGPKKKE